MYFCTYVYLVVVLCMYYNCVGVYVYQYDVCMYNCILGVVLCCA